MHGLVITSSHIYMHALCVMSIDRPLCFELCSRWTLAIAACMGARQKVRARSLLAGGNSLDLLMIHPLIRLFN